MALPTKKTPKLTIFLQKENRKLIEGLMKSQTAKSAMKSPTAESVRIQLISLGLFITGLFCIAGLFSLFGESQLHSYNTHTSSYSVPSYNPPPSSYSSDNNYGYNKETVGFLKSNGVSPSEARASEEIIRRNCGEACE